MIYSDTIINMFLKSQQSYQAPGLPWLRVVLSRANKLQGNRQQANSQPRQTSGICFACYFPLQTHPEAVYSGADTCRSQEPPVQALQGEVMC